MFKYSGSTSDNNIYLHKFLQLENFSPSMGKFPEILIFHERCRQDNHTVCSYISSLEPHYEETTFAFLILHHTKGVRWGTKGTLVDIVDL